MKRAHHQATLVVSLFVSGIASTTDGKPGSKTEALNLVSGIHGPLTPGRAVIPLRDEGLSTALFQLSRVTVPAHTRAWLDFYIDGSEPQCFSNSGWGVTSNYARLLSDTGWHDHRTYAISVNAEVSHIFGDEAVARRAELCRERDGNSRTQELHIPPEHQDILIEVAYRKGLSLYVREEPLGPDVPRRSFICKCGSTQLGVFTAVDPYLAARDCAPRYLKASQTKALERCVVRARDQAQAERELPMGPKEAAEYLQYRYQPR